MILVPFALSGSVLCFFPLFSISLIARP